MWSILLTVGMTTLRCHTRTCKNMGKKVERLEKPWRPTCASTRFSDFLGALGVGLLFAMLARRGN